jgi:hypothetical protein
MDWVLPLIAGLGIGSLLKSVVDHWIARRSQTTDRLYQEKRESYLGLLDALRHAAIAPSRETAKTFGLWQTRCTLFGSPEVSRHAQMMMDTDHTNQAERSRIFQELIDAMRADLHR